MTSPLTKLMTKIAETKRADSLFPPGSRSRLWGKLEAKIQRQAKDKDPDFRLNGDWKRKVRDQDGFKVYEVDADWVRKNLTAMFGTGGHGYVHECIPHDEIWIARCTETGSKLSKEYRLGCAVHEITEHKLMQAGKSFLSAHRKAEQVERKFKEKQADHVVGADNMIGKAAATSFKDLRLLTMGAIGGGLGTAGGMIEPADPENRPFSGAAQGLGGGLGAYAGGAGGYQAVDQLIRAGHLRGGGLRATLAKALLPMVVGGTGLTLGAMAGRGVARSGFLAREAVRKATSQPTYEELRKERLKQMLQASAYVLAGVVAAGGTVYGVGKLRDMRKSSSAAALGIPDRSVYGDLAKLPIGEQLNYVRQLHDAERAGLHEDLRFGNEPLGLYSWAVPKAHMPKPGERLLALRQPQHTNNYAEFEGRIHSKYGRGTVKTVDKGSVEITKVSPKVVSFVVTHHKHPETYSLVNTGDNKWLIVNTTPQKSKALEEHKKVKYTSVDPSKVKDFLNGDYAVSGKIDGASALFELFKDRIEAVSYRTQAGTKGKPIIHTYRMGLGSTKPPPELVGSVLKGEVYGERGGKAIPAQELGGLLNMSTVKSRAAQKERNVKLKAAIYDIASYRNEQPNAHYGERLALMGSIVPNIAPQTLELAPTETEPSAATKLFKRIQAGRHPLTAEGIVATPLVGGGAPTKLKFKEDADVYIKGIFPAVTKAGPPRAGGFTYSLEPEGPEVGRVGTGFTHEVLQDMLANPKDYIGRTARIEAQEKFPSGAFRAPSFTALHEG